MAQKKRTLRLGRASVLCRGLLEQETEDELEPADLVPCLRLEELNDVENEVDHRNNPLFINGDLLTADIS